jgi:hypothetical protein
VPQALSAFPQLCNQSFLKPDIDSGGIDSGHGKSPSQKEGDRNKTTECQCKLLAYFMPLRISNLVDGITSPTADERGAADDLKRCWNAITFKLPPEKLWLPSWPIQE